MRWLIVLLALPTSVAAETAVSALRVSTAVHQQFAPAVASDGDGYYAAWSDFRSDVGYRDFGAPVSQAASLVIPTGTSFSPLSGLPAVVWSGTRYIVLSRRDLVNVQAVRIDRSGTLEDIVPVQLLTEKFPDTTRAPLAVSNGRSILVSTRDRGSMIGLFDERLQPIATIQPASFVLDSNEVVGASDGESYLVVCRSASGGRGTLRIASRGEVLSSSTLSGWGTVGDSTLVWSGDSYIYITTDFDTDHFDTATHQIQAVRFDREGKPVGDVVTLVDNVRANFVRAERGENGRAVVVWDQNRSDTTTELFAMTTDGVTASTPHKIGEANGTRIRYDAPYSLARSSSAIMVAVETLAGIGFFPLAFDGSVAGPVPGIRDEATFSVVEQRRIAVDRNAPATLAVWEEEDGSEIERLMIERLNADGTAAGGEHLLWPSQSRQRFAAIARGPSDSLAVWIEGDLVGTVSAARVDDSGTLLDSKPLLLGTISMLAFDGPGDLTIPTDTPPSVIWDGHVFLVTFSGAGGDLRLSRVTGDGVLLDPQPAKVAAAIAGEQHKPAFTSVEGLTFLVWQEGSIQTTCRFFCIPPPAGVIRALRFSPGGVPIDPAPITVSAEPYSIHPDVASDGVRAVVTWVRSGRIYARRLSRDGTLSDPPPMQIGIGRSPARPTITASTDRLLIAWELDHRSLSLYDIVIASIGGNEESLLWEILPSGDLHVPLAFASASGPMIAYERSKDDAVTNGVTRLYLERIERQVMRRRAARH